MWKLSTSEKTEKKAQEYEKTNETYENLKAFSQSAKSYVAKSLVLYRAVMKRVMNKMSDMLSEELGQESPDYKKRTRQFILALVFVVVGFIISSTPFMSGVYPLALSIVSSAGSRVKSKREMAPRIIMGLSFFSVVLSTLRMGADGLIYFTVIFTVFMLRSVVTGGSFDESVVYRTITALFASVILSLCLLALHGVTLDTFFKGISLCTIAPLFSYLFSGVFCSMGEPFFASGIRSRVEIGFAAIAFSLVFALSEYGIFGFSLSAAAAFLITMTVAKTLGSLHGGIFGLACGVAAGGGLFCATFGIVGVICAALINISELLALSVAVLLSGAVSVYIGGFEGFVTVLPEVLFSSLISYPILKLLPLAQEKISLVSSLAGSSPAHEKESLEKGLEKLSGTFATLSEVFFAITDSMKTPSTEDVIHTIDNSCNKVCATCSMSGMCWSKYYSDTNNAKMNVTQKILANGRVSKNDFPDYFIQRCCKLDAICENINKRYASLCFKANDVSHANLIAGEYHTVSKLLTSTAQSFKEAEAKNEALSKKAYRAMRALNTSFIKIEAWGNRNSVIDVYGVTPERIEKSTAEIVAVFESECSMLFQEPEFIQLEKTGILRMKRRAPITLECAKKSVGKKGEKVNGDTISFFEKEDGNFYSLICDGMGSGRSAALTSKLASIFLEKLLTCTDDKKITLEMLNSLLMSKNDECFTTLDLIEIDLYEKKAGFMKAGACPSFVLRDENVYKVNSATLPAGIVSKITAEETKIGLKDGDVIVMLSDGIIDVADSAVEDNPWLVELLDERRDKSAGELCDAVLASSLSRFGATDDMSVAVIKVART